MNFDALTMWAVRDELRRLIGGRVQRVIIPDELGVGLEIYAAGKRHWLLASAHPQYARVHLTGEALTRASDKVTPLLLLLRKYVRDARLVDVSQLRLERVLYLDFRQRSEDEDGWLEFRLVVEVMGRYSNIVLVRHDGLVLDAVKRITADMNRYRITLPHHPYVPPPVQAGKMDPAAIKPSLLEAWGATCPPSTPLWRLLVDKVMGVSPLLGREIAFRVAGDAGATVGKIREICISPVPWGRVMRELQTIFEAAEAGHWEPCVADEGEVVAFAPYRLTHLSGHPVGSISAALDQYYSQMQVLSGHEQLRERLLGIVEDVRGRLLHKKEALERSLAQGAEAERLRRSGEYVLAYASIISPGQRELIVDDLVIKLDPSLSPVENAQAYFREYAKAKGALQEVPQLLEQTQIELSYLEQMAVYIAQAEGLQALQELERELAEAGYMAKEMRIGPSRKGGGRARSGRGEIFSLRSSDGLEILVGRSGRQNEEVTFRRAIRTDLWLHARGVPGAHVIIRAGGRPVPERTIYEAARQAAIHSKVRGSTQVAVDYTLVCYVRPIKGAPPGMVTYSHEKTIYVDAI